MMNKDFYQALRDGYRHVTDIHDPRLLATLRRDGILIDTEGMYTFSPKIDPSIELRVEPIGTENQFLIGLYKNGVLLTEKLPVWASKPK